MTHNKTWYHSLSLKQKNPGCQQTYWQIIKTQSIIWVMTACCVPSTKNLTKSSSESRGNLTEFPIGPKSGRSCRSLPGGGRAERMCFWWKELICRYHAWTVEDVERTTHHFHCYSKTFSKTEELRKTWIHL